MAEDTQDTTRGLYPEDTDRLTNPIPLAVTLVYGKSDTHGGRLTVADSLTYSYGLPDSITVTDDYGKSRTYRPAGRWWRRLIGQR